MGKEENGTGIGGVGADRSRQARGGKGEETILKAAVQSIEVQSTHTNTTITPPGMPRTASPASLSVSSYDDPCLSPRVQAMMPHSGLISP